MTIHIIPTLQDNYTYIVEVDDRAIIVDCGEAGPVIDFIKKNNINPSHILCTHHHGDHVDGLAALKKKYPDMQIYAPEKDIYRIPLADHGLKPDETISIDGIEIKCIETPGHTKNHLCFYLPELKSVFSGDALFSLGCGRLFEGDYEDLFYSMQKLKDLPDDTMIYCGHEYTKANCRFSLSVEPDNFRLLKKMKQVEELRANGQPTIPVSLGEEKSTNLFLLADSIEKIAQLRQLRDQF
ncbi:MAG: hydroxyacylglutathione hydrolase [Micavibrio aeruginosavorus]|uniref:Hydroxyacylglutathione hydrolase n=1 Tax=Micavibrio aeruginosavorus TaxID=349221 RepID=A0A2W5H9X1_9BACT|nr:MAG: hydroxyacylglutathione hydrolase [Micavibrio aeruginosavorus]